MHWRTSLSNLSSGEDKHDGSLMSWLCASLVSSETSRNNASAQPSIRAARLRCSPGLWLAESDHVTRKLASDWSALTPDSEAARRLGWRDVDQSEARRRRPRPIRGQHHEAGGRWVRRERLRGCRIFVRTSSSSKQILTSKQKLSKNTSLFFKYIEDCILYF